MTFSSDALHFIPETSSSEVLRTTPFLQAQRPPALTRDLKIEYSVQVRGFSFKPAILISGANSLTSETRQSGPLA